MAREAITYYIATKKEVYSEILKSTAMIEYFLTSHQPRFYHSGMVLSNRHEPSVSHLLPSARFLERRRRLSLTQD